MTTNLPTYAKATMIGIGIYLFVSVLYIAQGIIVPLLFGTILAILLHPVVCFFVRKKINRVLAIIITLLLSFIIVGLFAIFIISQISKFSDSWPIFVEKFTALFDQTIQWIPEYFDISEEKVTTWIAESKYKILAKSSDAIAKTLLSVGSSLVVIFIIPVYVFLMLFYKPLLLDFIHQLFGNERQKNVTLIVNKTKSVIQKYLIGLVIEAILVATLQSVGLLILGIDYAILLGIIGAMLNLIPYIGGLVAVGIPMMIALVTKESPWVAIYVMALYYAIQLIDNNFIVPKIVASKVKINALVSIIVVISGGALWGVTGMILAIPLIAIVKVICDNIDSLKPLGFLLGDTMPEITILNITHLKKAQSVKHVT